MPASTLNSATTRERLLASGHRAVLKHGLRGLTVREVAAGAKANLGSFVYHFGTRDAFVEELIETWYAPLLARVNKVAAEDGRPVRRLRSAILQLVDFSVDNDVFMGRILMAAADNDVPACGFLKSLAGRHPRILLQLVAAAQADGALVDDDPMPVLCFLMASVALPRLVTAVWQGPSLFGKQLSAALSHIARDRERMAQRLDWALRGVARDNSDE
ncbi:MAG TPA: TetR/AcrR family transcriptional regulator [Steroidobacteraceae bacterium]|nr:TetR/AcrR family transcriptional regulator [Steroidobacteraceae bacterium]